MNVEFRRADMGDVEVLVDLRLDFLTELRGELPPTSRQGNERYLRQTLPQGDYRAYLGRVSGEIVCGATMLISRLPPVRGPERLVGTLLNVYVYPDHRGRGYGRGLMRFIMEDAAGHGIDRLSLNATPEGEGLYASLGFGEPTQKAMTIDLTEWGKMP